MSEFFEPPPPPDPEPERYRPPVWVWPLPPPGPVTFVCVWPAAGIPLTRRGIDAQLILDAVARAQVIFAGNPG